MTFSWVVSVVGRKYSEGGSVSDCPKKHAGLCGGGVVAEGLGVVAQGLEGPAVGVDDKDGLALPDEPVLADGLALPGAVALVVTGGLVLVADPAPAFVVEPGQAVLPIISASAVPSR